LDLATGSLLGWALLRLWLVIEQPYRAWFAATTQQQPWQLPLQVLLVSFLLMRCYPMPSRWTSCYNYATAWAAGWAGATVGYGVLQQLQVQTATSPDRLLGGVVPPLALKIFLGLGMVAATKVVVKAVLMAVFKPVFALVPLSLRCWWQPPVVGAVRQQQRQLESQQDQQHSAQRLAGYATAVIADFSHAASPTSAVAAQTINSSSSKQQGDSSKAGSSSKSSTAGPIVWGLRHTPEGVGNDVVATARWCSYFAVGFNIAAWMAVWPVVLQWLAPSVSVS
jgi:hypothetical protein